MPSGKNLTPKKKNKPTSPLTWLILLVIIVLFAGLTFPGVNSGPSTSQKPLITQLTLTQLKMALTAYHLEYGHPPGRSENKWLASLLQGENPEDMNPRLIAFIEFNQGMVNSKQEIIDAWGTPLRFTFRDNSSFLIESAGKDQTFNTADDIDSSMP